MEKLKKSKISVYSVVLAFLCLLPFIYNAQAVVYMHPRHFDVQAGVIVDGNIYDILADDYSTLDIRWHTKLVWFLFIPQYYQYTIKIKFDMEVHKYLTLIFHDYHNVPPSQSFDRQITIYYTDGTKGWTHAISSSQTYYEITVEYPFKYIDYIIFYAQHTRGIFQEYYHYSYFDYVAAIPV